MSSDPRRLCIVYWSDSFGVGSHWADIEEPMDTPKPQINKSVGWVIHQDDQGVVTVPHISPAYGDENDQGCGDMTIPVSAVVKMIQIAEPEMG